MFIIFTNDASRWLESLDERPKAATLAPQQIQVYATAKGGRFRNAISDKGLRKILQLQVCLVIHLLFEDFAITHFVGRLLPRLLPRLLLRPLPSCSVPNDTEQLIMGAQTLLHGTYILLIRSLFIYLVHPFISLKCAHSFSLLPFSA